MNAQSQSAELDIALRLQLNALIDSFCEDPTKETALEIYKLTPINKKGNAWGMRMTAPSRPMSGLTEQGMLGNQEVERTSYSRGREEQYWRCGSYKVSKSETKIIIFKFNDIDDKGWHITRFENGDAVSMVINYQRGIPTDWGYNHLMRISFNLFKIRFSFMDYYYSMKATYGKGDFNRERKRKMFWSFFSDK